MYLVALTGSIATGKSTVASMLTELGCTILDADVIAREVVEPGKPALKKIIKFFGQEILDQDGTLNREKLGQIIFNDQGKRRVLNSITHPEIYKAMMWKVAYHALTGQQFVVLDLPLLFETGKMVPYMASILVVSCNESTQLERLKERNNYSTEEARLRINSQMPLKEKCRRATHIIDNSQSLANTQAQVERIYCELRKSKRHWFNRILLACALAIGVSAGMLMGSTLLAYM